MKKGIYIVSAFVLLGFVTMSFVGDEGDIPSGDKLNVDMPSEVKELVDNKCYGCHNSESKNTKGKKKLSFDLISSMSVYKQIGKYEGIHETVSEGEMPPKKFLKKYPNKALSTSEKEILLSWAKSEGEKLAK